MGTEAPGIFLPYHSVRMQHVIDKHIYKKMIMQKIDKKLCIVYRKAAMKAERYKLCDKQNKLDYLTCPGQGQAAELY